MNLVLKGGERINAANLDKLNKICEESGTLLNFLQKPLWDAT